MPTERSQGSPVQPMRPARFSTLAALTATLMLGACSASSDMLPSIAMKPDNATGTSATKVADASPQAELQRATDYWGEEYSKKPGELQPALNYAKDLKALGDKQKALQVLAEAGQTHGNDRELASEYGRLALDLNQVGQADRALAIADDPTKPDWRVISARGTVMAKQGKFAEAIPFYERALALSPNSASVLNNLAMAHAMMGNPKKAEPLLRQAMAATGTTTKVRDNLALVLGLQGRYDESKSVASDAVGENSASSNAAYLKQLVKLDAKRGPVVSAFKTKTKPIVAQNKPADTPTVWKTSVSGSTE